MTLQQQWQQQQLLEALPVCLEAQQCTNLTAHYLM
jgi:hypothetical protein